MRFERFIAKNIHGFMNFNIAFKKGNLTFITGINGSGKTTIVRCITALISPSLNTLSNIKFKNINLDLAVGQNKYSISCKRTVDELILQCSETDEILSIKLFHRDRHDPPRRHIKFQKEYYQEQEIKNADNGVLLFINSLPIPMLLDIDRRSQEYRSRNPRRRVIGASITPFAISLGDSLDEALELAWDYRFNVQKNLDKLTNDFRRDMILNAIRYEKTDVFPDVPESLRKLEDPIVSETRKGEITASLEDLGIESKHFKADLKRIFDKLKKSLTQFPKNKIISASMENVSVEEFKKLIDWAINKPRFDRLNKTIETVDKYNRKQQNELKHIDEYLSTVNSLLADSNKKIYFAERGRLRVKVGESLDTNLHALSSGEIQIIVLFTNLAFNPNAQAANVFIIDEPELSLHLRWQELFIDAIKKLSPDLQLILSTHSPAIILDKEKYCIDISDQN